MILIYNDINNKVIGWSYHNIDDDRIPTKEEIASVSMIEEPEYPNKWIKITDNKKINKIMDGMKHFGILSVIKNDNSEVIDINVDLPEEEEE
jgi:putative heme iron utilization protein